MATLEADYLVVGAGAAGMAFTDALIDHADVSVVMVDRRHGAGGHWLDAYPFVRLHQASAFYGVASTLLGDGRVQQDGPEAGLHERATAAEVCAYYARVLRERMIGSGRVSFYPSCEYLGRGQFVSRLSGKRYEVGGRRRVVDARYLSPQIPAVTPAPFGIADGVRVVAVNDLVRLGGAPSQYVIVGSGKTATDACIWLLDNGVDPGAICWVRPRDPWMLNRAVVQPDPAVYIGMAADTLEAAAEAASPDDLFYRLEQAGVMLRIDRSVTPTMAKTPTLAQWELDRLRTIEHVVRLGHIQHAEPARLVFGDGEAPIGEGRGDRALRRVRAAVPPVGADLGRRGDHAAADPDRLSLLRRGARRVRRGHLRRRRREEQAVPALAVLRTRPPTGRGCRCWAIGRRRRSRPHPDIKAWADRVSLNPARIPPDMAGSAELTAAVDRFRKYVGPGMARMAELAGRLRTCWESARRACVTDVTGGASVVVWPMSPQPDYPSDLTDAQWS